MADRQIFKNGKIFTSDDTGLYADSMVVQDGRILWIGKEEDLPEGEGAVTDLGGKRVIPGFVDAHMHPVLLADFRKKITIMPPAICSISDLQEAIRKKRREQGPGKWIEGWGYDETALAEKRSPNRYDLDAACSDAPVSLTRTCAHIRCVNSAALRLAGIDRNTPDPPGGVIERDAEGEPTGVLKENARDLLAGLIPAESREKKTENLLELGELLTSQGITAICDMGNLDDGDNIPVYEEAARRGFCQRVALYYMWDYFAGHAENFSLLEGRTDRNRQIFAAGLKLIGDGSVSGRTAWMEEPYLGAGDNCGFPVCTDGLMESAVSFCKSHGCQLSMHAMGTRAISRMVDRACREKPWTQEGVPFVRIEHATLPTKESMEKAAAAGIAFVTQPIFPYAESGAYVSNLGRERLRRCYPVKTILEHGVSLAFSTDAPATFWAVPSDPLPGLQLAVTRKAADGSDCGADQAVDMETAIILYTREAAAAAGFTGSGMLRAGFRADFAVLSDDILQIPPEDIGQVCVLETYVEGKCVYRRK